MAWLRTRPFGSSRAPVNWGRVTAFAKRLLAPTFAIYIAKYAVGCYSKEPLLTFSPACSIAKDLCALLGSRLELRKESPPLSDGNLLGASIALGSRSATAAFPEHREPDFVMEVKEIPPYQPADAWARCGDSREVGIFAEPAPRTGRARLRRSLRVSIAVFRYGAGRRPPCFGKCGSVGSPPSRQLGPVPWRATASTPC